MAPITAEFKKSLPDGFAFWIEALAMEIILEKPNDIPKFGLDFFKKQLSHRAEELNQIPIRNYFYNIFSNKITHKKKGKDEMIQLKRSYHSTTLDAIFRRDSSATNSQITDDDLEYLRSIQAAMSIRLVDEQKASETEDVDAPSIEDLLDKKSFMSIFKDHLITSPGDSSDEDDAVSHPKSYIKSPSIVSKDRVTVKSIKNATIGGCRASKQSLVSCGDDVDNITEGELKKSMITYSEGDKISLVEEETGGKKVSMATNRENEPKIETET